jgi:hypothetical protein
MIMTKRVEDDFQHCYHRGVFEAMVMYSKPIFDPVLLQQVRCPTWPPGW